MTLNNVAFGKHQERFEQMSIYDFIEDSEKTLRDYEKSQEVQPSETDPQVDEAQEEKRVPVMFRHEWKTESPSSALDTSKLISENLVFNLEGYAEKVTELPTEDTDSTLFSVGDVLTVKDASDVYSYSHEFYDYLKQFSGDKVIVLGVKRLKCNNKVSVKVEVIRTCKEISFYDFELQK